MNEIKNLRKKTGLSQSKFADKYHINISTLRHWEQNVQKVPEYYLYLLRNEVKRDYGDITKETWEDITIKRATEYSKEKNIPINSITNIFTTPCFDNYDDFKSYYMDYLQENGETKLAYLIVKRQLVKTYWYLGYYKESFFLLDILDTYCNRKDIPLKKDLDKLRRADRNMILGEEYVR